MSSVELGDTEDIVNKYLPDFENNKSKVVRHCILYYDEQRTKQNHKLTLTTMFQMSIFFFLGVGLLCFTINMFYGYQIMFIGSTFLLIASIELLIFSMLLGLKKNDRINNTYGGINIWR